MMRIWLAALLMLALSACARASAEDQFAVWLTASPERGAAFARFEAMLEREGVADVVAAREIWTTDRLAPNCVTEAYTMPPEALWPQIVPALRFIRDHVIPAIGQVRVVSAFRDQAFNTCIRGARGSAHVGFHALDLVPVDPAVTRERLIAELCPVHARQGPTAGIGLGIYSGRRFHIDARRFRGWGADHHGASFPCR